MPRILLIGDHGEFKRGLEAAVDLAGCEIAMGCVRSIRPSATFLSFT